MAKRLSEHAQQIAEQIDADRAKNAERLAVGNELNKSYAQPGNWYTHSDIETGMSKFVYKSAIVGGDELVVGTRYVLERAAPKSAEPFELGAIYIALGTGDDGEFSGEVIDQQFRTFIVGAGDLFLLAK